MVGTVKTLRGDVTGKNWSWGNADGRGNNESTDLAGQSLACWKKKESLCAGAEKLTKQESACQEMVLEDVVRRKI